MKFWGSWDFGVRRSFTRSFYVSFGDRVSFPELMLGGVFWVSAEP